MSYKRVVDINNFTFESFDGDKAKWPAYAQQAAITAGINEGRHKGLLRSHLMAVKAWLAWMDKQPGSEDWPIDHETFLYVNSDDDDDLRDLEEDLYRVCNTAFHKSFGTIPKQFLKKTNGGSMDDVTMRTIMDQLAAKYGTVTPTELAMISAPLFEAYDAQAGVSIDAHVDNHVNLHETIRFFDDGKHAMPEAMKITTLCDSIRGCNLYAADVKIVTSKKLHTFDEWTEAFKESVADTPYTATTGKALYAARAAIAAPNPAPHGEQMISVPLREYEAAMAARATLASSSAVQPPAKRTRVYPFWCYVHGPNTSHGNAHCSRVHEIPADKMESTAQNTMGGPLPRKHRYYKKN